MTDLMARPDVPNRTRKCLRPPLRWDALGLVLLSLLLAGCGDPAEPAPPVDRPAVLRASSPDDLLTEIPRQELYGAAPEENLWSPRYELEVLDLPRAWDGARLAIVADMQLGRYPENERVAAAAVRRAVEAGPDVVLLLGEFLVEGGDAAVLRRVLEPIRGRQAVAVLGRRDVRTDSIEAVVTDALTGSGVQVVRNGTATVQRQGVEILIAGLDPEVLDRTFADQQFILATLGEPERTPIVLMHNAPLATRAPMGRFPITVAGNTFCGSVEVPGTPRLSWLRTEIFPEGRIEASDRLFRVQGGTVLVACGIGYTFVPTRFGSAPEVPILTLVRVGPPQPPTQDEVVADTVIERFQGLPADTAPAAEEP